MMIPTQEHCEFLIRTFQKRNNLTPDGVYGAQTAAKIDYYLELDRPKLTGLEAVWESASKDVGKGGDLGTNNVSDYIKELREECGYPTMKWVGRAHTPINGPWCGVGISAHLQRCGIPIKSRGAYRLVETMIAHEQGYEVDFGDMELDKVYVAVWKRKGWDTKGLAHVRLVKPIDDTGLEFIEFNGKGDEVCTGAMSWDGFRRDLLRVAGWQA